MIRSFFSGVSGLKSHQVRLDVTGNNIANVNTIGFKKGRVNFQDLLSQTIREAKAVGEGANPQQIGSGATISSIDNVYTQGFSQTTDNPLDVMIQGDGFFVLTDANGNEYYTRVGSFGFDESGNLINNAAKGFKVKGDTDLFLDDPEARSFNITSAGELKYTKDDGTIELIGTIQLVRFPNPAGLKKIGDNLFAATEISGTVGGGTAIEGTPGADGLGIIVPGALEMSNVDLSEEMTQMITTQRGFQANARTITVSDQFLEEVVNLKR
ncbi:MAG: flagellar hook-basal body complex protein [Bacillota bacterium]